MNEIDVDWNACKHEKVSRSVVHKLPVKIDYTGEGQISNNFCIADDKTASFRGRKLEGEDCSVPENYTAVVMLQSAVTTDTEESKFNVTNTFDKYTAWGWDMKPVSTNFNKLIAVQNALHGK